MFGSVVGRDIIILAAAILVVTAGLRAVCKWTRSGLATRAARYPIQSAKARVPGAPHARLGVRHGQAVRSSGSGPLGRWGRAYNVDDVTGTDDVTERILTMYDTITVVGASADPAKAAHGVPALMQRHGWRIIPVNPRGGAILGEQSYRTLAEVPEQVGLVDVFRPAHQAPGIARQAVAAGATALWLQLGIASAEAREIAEAAGLLYVEDRCLAIEQRRLGLDAPSRPRDAAPR